MNDDNKIEFGQMLYDLSETYSKNVTQKMIEEYWEHLSGYSFDEILNAKKQVVSDKTNGFYPVPGEFLEVLRSKHQYIAIEQEETSEEDKLWGKYQSLLIGCLGRHYSKKSWVKGIYRFKKSHRRWDMASNPTWRYEWFRKHTDMPEDMLNRVKNEFNNQYSKGDVG